MKKFGTYYVAQLKANRAQIILTGIIAIIGLVGLTIWEKAAEKKFHEELNKILDEIPDNE